MKRLLLPALLLLATAACGGAENSRTVTSTEFQDDWMLTVDSGTLVCEPPAGIVFIAPDGTEYAVNGTATGMGYADIQPIWKADPSVPAELGLKISIDPLITAGMELCE